LSSGFLKLDEKRVNKVIIFKQNTAVYMAVSSIVDAVKQLHARGETFDEYYALMTWKKL
jgi:hypothetical protein